MTLLCSWAFDGSLRTWDLRKNQAMKAVDGGGGKIFGAVRLPDDRILFQAKDRLMRTWDTQSDAPLECWKVADFVEQHPELVQLYKARNKKLPDPAAVEGFHCTRSTVVVEHEHERASWQGEGYWSTRHGAGTLVVTNDKNLVFLQLWRGNERLGSAEIAALLS